MLGRPVKLSSPSQWLIEAVSRCNISSIIQGLSEVVSLSQALSLGTYQFDSAETYATAFLLACAGTSVHQLSPSILKLYNFLSVAVLSSQLFDPFDYQQFWAFKMRSAVYPPFYGRVPPKGIAWGCLARAGANISLMGTSAHPFLSFDRSTGDSFFLQEIVEFAKPLLRGLSAMGIDRLPIRCNVRLMAERI